MRTTCAKVLVLTAAMLLLLGGSLCYGTIPAEDEPKAEQEQQSMREEMVERALQRIAETNPERAEELKKLRAEDPNQFKVEFGKIMHEQFARRYREQPGGGGFGGEGRDMPGRPDSGFGGRGGFSGRGGFGGWSETEFIEWLQKNYPEDANELAELKEKDQELYMRQLRLTLRRVGKIFEASKENPKLAEVLKEDLELKKARDELLDKIKATSDEDEKKKLTEGLEKIVGGRFDLLIQRRQLEYEGMREELERLKERLKQSEAELEKWKAAKDEKVKERTKELLERPGRFRWD